MILEFLQVLHFMQIYRVMNCMETGATAVLHNLDEIHEALYDLLNQRYTVTRAGKIYRGVVLGAESRTCFIEPRFKCVVLVSKNATHKSGRVSIAFLNRFEKQLIPYLSSLTFEWKNKIGILESRLLTYKMSAKEMSTLFPDSVMIHYHQCHHVYYGKINKNQKKLKNLIKKKNQMKHFI